MRSLTMKLAGALLATTTLAMPAAADGPNYNYGQLSYVDIEFDDIDGVGLDGDGFDLAGSVAIADMVHVFASYTDGDIDVDDFGYGDINADYTELTAGIGLNYAVSETIDLVGRLGYVNAEVEISGFDADETGYALGAGLRAMVTPQLELNGGITYTDLGGEIDSDTGLDVGAVYSFTEMFAVAAGIGFSDDVTQYGLGLRVYFGR
ncbi:MAG: outer membrane beta-barrel protein [Gammaproteobacteria bacterium]|nr:outer membrane beta-barrel protein [Gammaproteobacteria bacterium]